MVMFGSKIYGVYYTSSNTFEIWRTANIGSKTASWKIVVKNSFGDPKNNSAVAIMAVFNKHIYGGTDTLQSMFGDPKGKDTGGVEIWESPSGDLGSWTQVNVDGFGTAIPYPGDPSKKLYTNHVVGSWTVFKGNLYIATKSHWGAQIWKYDGTGKKGWKDVTPSWAGPGTFFASESKRFESMIPFQGSLYAAEGYPSGNLSVYDGKSWSFVVKGPKPFDPNNTRLQSLVVFKNRLYVTAGWPAGPHGDQVWGYSFKTPKPDIKANGSDGPITVSPSKSVMIAVTLDAGELVGQKADWYLVALAPWGVYSVVWGKGWVPGIVPILQYPLFDLTSPFPVFNDSLPAGNYIAAFGVDDRPDGKLNGTLWWDFVGITSKP
jgi:hypothetical protein